MLKNSSLSFVTRKVIRVVCLQEEDKYAHPLAHTTRLRACSFINTDGGLLKWQTRESQARESTPREASRRKQTRRPWSENTRANRRSGVSRARLGARKERRLGRRRHSRLSAALSPACSLTATATSRQRGRGSTEGNWGGAFFHSCVTEDRGSLSLRRIFHRETDHEKNVEYIQSSGTHSIPRLTGTSSNPAIGAGVSA